MAPPPPAPHAIQLVETTEVATEETSPTLSVELHDGPWLLVEVPVYENNRFVFQKFITASIEEAARLAKTSAEGTCANIHLFPNSSRDAAARTSELVREAYRGPNGHVLHLESGCSVFMNATHESGKLLRVTLKRLVPIYVRL